LQDIDYMSKIRKKERKTITLIVSEQPIVLHHIHNEVGNWEQLQTSHSCGSEKIWKNNSEYICFLITVFTDLIYQQFHGYS
jgi:hypothetical protein